MVIDCQGTVALNAAGGVFMLVDGYNDAGRLSTALTASQQQRVCAACDIGQCVLGDLTPDTCNVFCTDQGFTCTDNTGCACAEDKYVTVPAGVCTFCG